MPYGPFTQEEQSVNPAAMTSRLEGNPGDAGGGDLLQKDAFQKRLDDTQPQFSPVLCRYPADLGNNPEMPFTMKFDIYETGGASLNKKREVQNAVEKDVVETLGKANPGESRSWKDFASGLGGVIGSAGAGLVDGTKNAATGGLSNLKRVDQLGKGRDTFVEEYLGLENLTQHVSTVYLYMPGSLKVKYGIDYEDTDLSGMEIVRLLASLTDSHGSAGAVAQSEMARSVGMSLTKSVDNLAETLGLGGGIASTLKATTRQIQNPLVVHLFKGVQRRQFTFSFTMIPRSTIETQAIENIVRQFRKYALPRRSEGGRFLDFPGEFDISFLYNNREVIQIPKIRKCALVGIDLSYGPDDVFVALRPDERGYINPSMVKMDLTFSELELLTQQAVDDHGA